MNKQVRNLVVVGVLGLSALGLLSASCKTVPAGHIGIVTVFGKVSSDTVSEGMHIMNPFANVIPMSLQVQAQDYEHGAATEDMQNVAVKIVINFRLIPDRAREVYQKIGIDYSAKIVGPASAEVLKAETAKYKANEILSLRHTIKVDVQKSLSEWVSKYGIDLHELAIINVGFDADYATAIEQKQIQEQLAAQKQYELTKAQREAEIAQATAKGTADAAREAAKGRADALRIEGDAQADFNRKVAASLTDTLIQSEYLKRWDGKLPHFMAGDRGQMLFQVATKP